MLSIHDFNGKLIIFKTKHNNFSPYFTRTVPVIVGFPCQCWSRILASFSIQYVRADDRTCFMAKYARYIPNVVKYVLL